MASAEEIECLSPAGSQGLLVNCNGCGDVLESCAGSVEDNDLFFFSAAGFSPGDDLAELCVNLVDFHSRIDGVMQFTDVQALIENVDDYAISLQ